MAKKYGLPYQGSKSKLAEDIINVLPKAKHLYDLFAGGCAITHCALESGKWKYICANDLQDAPSLFMDAINGKYRNEKRWISREQFHAEKEIDPYIRWVWSFGNNGATYLFGKEIEEVKKDAHEYLMENGYDGTKEKRIELVKQFKADKKIQKRFELEQLERLEQLQQLQQLERLERLEQLQQLEQLERLERLEQLEQLERLEITKLDYRKVKIKKESVVYCDIPYIQKATSKHTHYGVDFNSDAFYTWARNSEHPVYFSSVFAPDDFKVVFEKAHQCRMKNKGLHGKKEVIEKLFWNGK